MDWTVYVSVYIGLIGEYKMANVDSLNTFHKKMLTHVDVGSCFPVRARLGLMHLSCVRWPPELLPRCALLLLLSCDDALRSAALEHPSLHIFVELPSAVAGSTSSRAGLRLPYVWAWVLKGATRERLLCLAQADCSSTCGRWDLADSGAPLECVEQPRPGKQAVARPEGTVNQVARRQTWSGFPWA